MLTNQILLWGSLGDVRLRTHLCQWINNSTTKAGHSESIYIIDCMTPVSHEIYFTLPCSRFHSSIRNRLYIIHLILESILTRSLVDLMDLMDLLSHRYHRLHGTSQSWNLLNFSYFPCPSSAGKGHWRPINYQISINYSRSSNIGKYSSVESWIPSLVVGVVLPNQGPQGKHLQTPQQCPTIYVQLQEHFIQLRSYTKNWLEYIAAAAENNNHHTDESRYSRYLVRDILRSPVPPGFPWLLSLVDFIDFMTLVSFVDFMVLLTHRFHWFHDTS